MNSVEYASVDFRNLEKLLGEIRSSQLLELGRNEV